MLGLFPARMREISSPRLKAWLNMRRVWNVDMNGNHENIAMGMKMSIPIPASYSRAIERTDFHSPSFFIKGFQAEAIWKPDNLVLKWGVERDPSRPFSFCMSCVVVNKNRNKLLRPRTYAKNSPPSWNKC